MGERVGGLLGTSVGQNVGFGVGLKVGPAVGWVGLYVVGPRVGVSVSDSTPEKNITIADIKRRSPLFMASAAIITVRKYNKC